MEKATKTYLVRNYKKIKKLYNCQEKYLTAAKSCCMIAKVFMGKEKKQVENTWKRYFNKDFYMISMANY